MATKTQTKTSTAAMLASKLKVENILQFTLVQSTLQANFKAILQALSDHDTELGKAKQDSKNNGDKIGKLQVANEVLSSELGELKDLVNKLSTENQYIRLQLDQKNSKSPNPQSQSQLQNSKSLQEILKQLNAIKQRTSKLENNTNKNSQASKIEIDKLRKQLSEMGKNSDFGNRIKELEKLFKDIEARTKDMNGKIKDIQASLKESNQNEKEDLGKLIDEINSKLNQFINGEYKQKSDKTDSKLEELEKLIQQNKANIQQEKRMRNKLSQQLWKLHDSVSKFSQNSFQKQLNTDALKQLKKEIAQLQKRLNELISNSTHKTNFNDTTAHQSPSKYKLQTESPSKQALNTDLRQEMLQRLKQLKADIMRNMKKIDLRSDGDSGYDKKRIDAIEEAIMRLDHLIADKAGAQAVKKMIQNLENKISYIYNLFMGESEEDACIAKRNWVCLSCDKKLDKYQGKIGHHLINDKLKVKTLDQDYVGGGMTLKPSKSRVDLPNVYSKTSKKL